MSCNRSFTSGLTLEATDDILRRCPRGRKLFATIGDGFYPAGTRMSPQRVCKWPCDAPEADALLYVAANTTIPVPKVYKTFRYRGYLVIEMQFVQGLSLGGCWRNLSADEKKNVVHELGSYVQQLRDLKPPKAGMVASTSGGPCREVRVGQPLFGPFSSVDAFHECLRGGMLLENAEQPFGEAVRQCHARRYATNFTHGDLGVQNILIRDGKIAAIIDWECAGWYPEYWEYTRAHYNVYDLPDFYQMLREQMKRYDNELAAERQLWRRLDQPLDQPRR